MERTGGGLQIQSEETRLSKSAFSIWGEHPMAETSCSKHVNPMKHKSSSPDPKQKPEPALAIPQVKLTDLNQNARDFVTSPDEVARRAYFAYLNEGSLPGHEVQHWLAAEAELIAERNQTRHHGFHNRT